MLNGVGVVSGSVMAPIVKSKPGKAFFSMVPGEVLLASLDALSKSKLLVIWFHSVIFILK